jgi:DNA-binding NarL/FixJ family response regulator
MKRVLILGAHEVAREGLKYFIDRHFGGCIFGEASTASGAFVLAREQDWDAAILDSTLEERSCLDALKELKQIRPRLPILVLSTHSEVDYATRAFQAGAAGYIAKDSPRGELVKAVNKVIEGRRYVSPAIAERLAGNLKRGAGQPLHHTLSYRELEVMRHIASGKTLGEIAGLLGLSNKTVSTYRARVLEKMRMKTNSEIIRYAVHNELGELRKSTPPGRRLRNDKPLAQSPRTDQPDSSMALPPAASRGTQRLRIFSGLAPYVGSAGANQILESVADDGEGLQRKVESLLRAFLGETAGLRLASRIMDGSVVRK